MGSVLHVGYVVAVGMGKNIPAEPGENKSRRETVVG